MNPRGRAPISVQATISIDPHVSDLLAALAAERGMEPGELLAELVLEAEITQRVDEVNTELERLLQDAPARRERRAQTRGLEETVESWMRV